MQANLQDTINTSFMSKIKVSHILILFVLLHLALFNINAAEWGDSYRILRASEFIREGSYPEDEKRPPLFSILLAARPENVDQVFWGRLEMLGFSLMSFFVFYKLVEHFFSTSNSADVETNELNLSKRKIALLLFTLNPVYLYWSIRIMADVPFTLFVLVAFYILYVTFEKLPLVRATVLGFVVGLSVLMRFEGYILFVAIGLGILTPTLQDFGNLISLQFLKSKLKEVVAYLGALSFTLAPFFAYRNPLSSSYFEEPSNRDYDLNMIAIYVLSFLFLFGFVVATFFLLSKWKDARSFLGQHLAIASFLAVESLLILAWPAAIPRIFVPTIPFFIVLLSTCLVNRFKSCDHQKLTKKPISLFLTMFGLLAMYIAGQFFYKLQFLVLIKPLIVAIVLLTCVQIYAIYQKRLNYFVISMTASMLLWSGAVIYIHKDIFKVVQAANVYIVQNLQGRIGYNDVSSVSDWYLNQKDPKNDLEGFYFDLTKKENRELPVLLEKNLDYLLVTNEHNTDTTLDISPWPHLKEIAEFRSEVNGEGFFTKVIEVVYP